MIFPVFVFERSISDWEVKVPDWALLGKVWDWSTAPPPSELSQWESVSLLCDGGGGWSTALFPFPTTYGEAVLRAALRPQSDAVQP